MINFNKQGGFSLIELMIASALGVVVSYFVMNIMITSTRSATTSDGLAEAQETGRFVLSFLHAEARRAGFNFSLEASSTSPFADTCAINVTPGDPGADCTFNSDDDDSGDRLAVRWTYNSDGTGRNNQDCSGAALTVADGTNLVDLYWVESDIENGDGYNDVLKCATYNDATGINISSVQTIASGILAMHVLYGVFDENESTGAVTTVRYVSADEIAAAPGSVRSARISILTRSFSDSTLDQANRSYILLDSEPYQFNDRISRYIQTSTVSLNGLNNLVDNI